MSVMEKKAMIGHKIRRFRLDQDLNQTEMAEQLSISPSYLNLIEHNQRPVTVPLLFRLSQTFEVDIREFAEDDDAHLASDLTEVFADPLFQTQPVSQRDIKDLVNASPTAARGFLDLYKAYSNLREDAETLNHHLSEQEKTIPTHSAAAAIEEVREYQETQLNHFPSLESAAEVLRGELNATPDTLCIRLTEHLEQHHSVITKIMPSEVMGNTLRHYRRHERRVLLSESVPASGRIFQLAVQTVLFENGDLLNRIVENADLKASDANGILRTSLANYFAGAVMMPYEAFHAAAAELHHDLELLQQRFGASFEQICHRLTTLQRPGRKGIPFFFIRVDKAGNVSKRLSGGGFKFARFGGPCPRLIVHDAFSTQGRILTQIATMPDNTSFFTIARTVDPIAGWASDGTTLSAIALGCEIHEAKQIAYATGLDLKHPTTGTPVGVSCRVCERLDCNQRAHPPLHQALRIDNDLHRTTPFLFAQ